MALKGAHEEWDYLIKPYKIAFEKKEDNQYAETIIVEPLERGFGVTLGNALRRVLLSSIQGAAVTSIRIPGALLEFASLPGVIEDVIDIVLNLKSLNLSLQSDQSPQKFYISEKGPCIVTAGMIQGGNQLKILDPSQVICTLNEGAHLDMDIYVSKGNGYVPAFSGEQRQMGEIILDAQFSPVKRVSYEVQHTRVAQSTDYDRLLLTVETNGAVAPKEAVSMAASILKDQLNQFVSFDIKSVEAPAKIHESISAKASFPMVFFKNVKELELSVRCLNCLQNEGVVYVGDLVKKKDVDLLRTPNFGRKSLNDISEALSKFGLQLGMEYPDWPPENIDSYLQEHQKL